MNENTTQLMEKFGDKLDHHLQALAIQAGIATEHFWPIFVRQQMIEGVTSLFAMVLSALIAFFLFKMFINSSKEDNSPKNVIGFVFGMVLSIMCFGIMINEGANSIGKIFNPEYYAVQSLVEMVK